MKLIVFTAFAVLFSVPHLVAGSIYSSVTASAGEYVRSPPDTVIFPCSGNGITQYECSGPQGSPAYAIGTANAAFTGGSIDTFGLSLNLSQTVTAYGNGMASGFANATTIAGVDAFGLASGGTGTGTLTYDVQISGPCVAENGCSTGVTFPSFIIPPAQGSSFTCFPGQPTAPFECFQESLKFTYGVPFPFSFQISFADGGTQQDWVASQSLSVYNLAVSDGASVEFSLAEAPEAATFRLVLLGVFTVGLIAFRRQSRKASWLIVVEQ